jgi:hypothetical protein
VDVHWRGVRQILLDKQHTHTHKHRKAEVPKERAQNDLKKIYLENYSMYEIQDTKE